MTFDPAPDLWLADEDLADYLASFTDLDIPAEEDPGFWPDPDTGRPAELAGLTEEELTALAAPPFQPPGMSWPEGIVPPDGLPGWPAGLLPRDGTGGGTGFADGGVLDVAAPGVALAGFAEDAHAMVGRIDDDSLIGLIRGWRRLASWAAGRELAAVAELARRRPAEGTSPDPVGPGGFPRTPSEFIADEIAAALTLTVRAAQAELGLAADLASCLTGTAAALAAGQIDLAKAKVIAAGTADLAAGHAAAVEAAVLPRAPGLTTSQLRAAVAKAVLAADPDAARRQREQAEKHAYVDCWTGPCGTGHLEGHDLPPAQTLAADQRLCQIAAAWKNQGAQGGLDLLRAHAYLALLLGHDITTPPPSLFPDDTMPSPVAPGPEAPAPDGAPVPAGLRRPVPAVPAVPLPPLAYPLPPLAGPLPPLAGMISLTVPLATLLQLSDGLAEAAGYGPLDPGTARALATAAAGHPATRWQLIVTGPDGRAVGHGTARRAATSQDHPGGGWTVTITTQPIATGQCGHDTAEPGYRPSPALQRLVRARHGTCTYPSCRRPAPRCDLDHSRGYDDGGITCECNLAPLCRRHHRLKQDEQWKLEQPSPGVIVWLTPAGRRYTTLPSQHPT